MRSSQRLRRTIIAAGCLLVAAIIGSAVWDGWRLYQQVVMANARELGNLANALAAQAAHTLQSVDVLLTDTEAWYEASGAGLPPEVVQQSLAQRVTSAPEVSVLTVVDAQGMQRYRSRATGEPLASVADRPYFQVQREGTGAGLFINSPLITRAARTPALVLSRRLNKPDGTFAGVVSAVVTLERLQSMYMAIHPGEHSAMLLTLDDGTLIIRQPLVAGLTTAYPQLLALKGGLRFDRSISPMDGKPKLIAAVGVDARPLILAVTRDEEEALQPWHEEVWSSAVRTVLLSLLVVGTIAALLRQLRRLERGEQALRRSEERYAMAMEAANEGHAEWNIPQDTVFVSQQWRTLHGVGSKVSIMKSGDIFSKTGLHKDDRLWVHAAVEDHLAGRTAGIEIEYRVQDTDGSSRWVHVRGRCLRDSEGAARRLFCSAADVSARKRAEIEKSVALVRLQQTRRLEALGTLAGGIAHDFNNILAAILGFGEMAQQSAPDESPQRRHIDRVLQAGARARLLVRRILDFSRSGIVEHAQVDLQALVEEVVAMLAPTLPAGIRIDARLDTDQAVVVGDATQLYQVVTNLCANAVQAMGASGVLSLQLERVQVPQSESLMQGEIRPGPYLRLVVADTGVGITAEVLERMFEPFFTTKEVSEGSGLGLSVVHGIVADLGGAIDVQSSPGQGSRIAIWLPLAAGSLRSAPQAELDAADWPRGNGAVVMVVDDEQALVELAEELLAGLGYEAVGFDSSEAALRAFEADPQRFDAVISDEMLPGMSGSAFASRLRALRPSLPVLLMSGRVDEALEHRARAAGVQRLLRKPLTLRELAEELAQALEREAPTLK